MNATELESMVVRLIGDASSFLKSLFQSQKAAEQTADGIQKAANRIETLAESLRKFGKRALEVLTLFGVAKTFGGAFEKYSDYE